MRGLVPVVVMVVVASARLAQADSMLTSVLDRRWAVALAYGAETMRADAVEAEPLVFGTFELSAHYRVLAHLELGLTVSGGGTFSVGRSGFHASARYRMLPERAWNPLLLVGLGIADAHGTDGGASISPRFSMRMGGGIERRFRSWAFATELHLIGIAADASVMDAGAPTAGVDPFERHAVVAATMTLHATYYFGSSAPTRRSRVP